MGIAGCALLIIPGATCSVSSVAATTLVGQNPGVAVTVHKLFMRLEHIMLT